jgi:hypothetical protein
VWLFILIVATLASSSKPAIAKIELAKFGLHPLLVRDDSGKVLDYATIGETIKITTNVSAMNTQYVGVPFTIITEIRDRNGMTVYLEAVELVADVPYTEGHASTDFAWLPEAKGKHVISVTTLSNLTKPEMVTPRRTVELSVLGECNLPNCLVLGADDEFRQLYRRIGTLKEGPAKQKAFAGLFTFEPDENCKTLKIVRCTPYKLDGKSVYTGSDNLDDYVGKVRIRDISLPSYDAINLDEFVGHRVEIIGKIFNYHNDSPVEEILAIRIRIMG